MVGRFDEAYAKVLRMLQKIRAPRTCGGVMAPRADGPNRTLSGRYSTALLVHPTPHDTAPLHT
jgi:hypothetical protein